MLEYFLRERLSSRMDRQRDGSQGHARHVHTRVIGSGPEGIRKLRSLKQTVEDSQVAAALTLKSENAVSPSLPQVVTLGWYSAWFDISYA